MKRTEEEGPHGCVQVFEHEDGGVCRVSTLNPWDELKLYQKVEVEDIAMRWFACSKHTDLPSS